MSRQIELKFKKMLKKAEFVHADLEYHEELLGEAKSQFSTAITEIVDSLPDEEKEEFLKLKQEILDKRRAAMEAEIKAKEAADATEPPLEAPIQETAVAESEDEYIVPDVEPQRDLPEVKENTIKKLFYKIAAKTHPDKFASSGLAPEELSRIESIFKKAKSSYENGNWYGLYTIALDLGIEIEDITMDHVDWIEDDVHHTLGRIAQIAQLVAWAWYTSDDKQKKSLIRNHFSYTYGFSWTPPTD
jgi:hypothetical protein|tara:strand:- start:2835 stop:3569 length:735 start_codon:yes stop_codon:yes gene_type:complete